MMPLFRLRYCSVLADLDSSTGSTRTLCYSTEKIEVKSMKVATISKQSVEFGNVLNTDEPSLTRPLALQRLEQLSLLFCFFKTSTVFHLILFMFLYI